MTHVTAMNSFFTGGIIIGVSLTIFFSFTPYVFGENFSVSIPQGAYNRLCATFHNCYSPEEITIKEGDTIKWTNDDTELHSVTSGEPGYIDEKFDSGLYPPGESWSWTFSESGKYDYFCTIHPWMIGSVIVNKSDENDEQIPEWVRNIAKWWSINKITDSEFAYSLQYLIEQQIIRIPETQQGESSDSQIPSWLRKNAGWWSQGLLSDDEFIKSIQYLITSGMIKI